MARRLVEAPPPTGTARYRRLVATAAVAAALGAQPVRATCAGAPFDTVLATIFGTETCAGADVNGDGRVTIADVTATLLLPPSATPTPSPTATLAATSTPTETNVAPLVPLLPIYRTYPGYEIGRPLEASDPNPGQLLSYAPLNIPEGGDLGADGIFRWTPQASQLGPFYVDFSVADDGVPPLSTSGTLAIAVTPLDACVEPSCDTAVGCSATLVPLAEPCCAGVVPVRVSEPSIGCPADLTLQIGRNARGFGRLRNCDRFRLIASAQTSVTVRVNVRGRCLPIGTAVTIAIRLEVASRVLVNRSVTTTLRAGDDGYAERLLIFVPVDGATPSLEGQEANLSAAILVGDEPAAVTSVRVVLTHDSLPDLPEL